MENNKSTPVKLQRTSVSEQIFAILKQKIVLSVLYFIVTLLQCYVAYAYGVSSGNALLVVLLGVASSVLASVLGKMGSHLFAGKFGPYVAG